METANPSSELTWHFLNGDTDPSRPPAFLHANINLEEQIEALGESVQENTIDFLSEQVSHLKIAGFNENSNVSPYAKYEHDSSEDDDTCLEKTNSLHPTKQAKSLPPNSIHSTQLRSPEKLNLRHNKSYPTEPCFRDARSPQKISPEKLNRHSRSRVSMLESQLKLLQDTISENQASGRSRSPLKYRSGLSSERSPSPKKQRQPLGVVNLNSPLKLSPHKSPKKLSNRSSDSEDSAEIIAMLSKTFKKTESLNRKLKVLESKLEHVTQEKRELQESYDSKCAEEKELISQVKSLENKTSGSEEIMGAKINELQRQIESLNEDINRYNNENEVISAELHKGLNEKKVLTEKLRLKSDELDTHIKLADEKNMQIRNEMQQSLSLAKAENVNFKAQLMEKDIEVTDLKNNVDELRAVERRLLEQLKQFEEELKSVNATKDLLNEEISTLKAEQEKDSLLLETLGAELSQANLARTSQVEDSKLGEICYQSTLFNVFEALKEAALDDELNKLKIEDLQDCLDFSQDEKNQTEQSLKMEKQSSNEWRSERDLLTAAFESAKSGWEQQKQEYEVGIKEANALLQQEKDRVSRREQQIGREQAKIRALESQIKKMKVSE